MKYLSCVKGFPNVLNLKKTIVLMLSSFPVFVFAEAVEPTLSKNLEPSNHLGQIILSLAIILLLIFISAWLMKRFGKVNGLASNHMKVLGNMSVGQRERIILLEVGDEQLLIGVTSSKISLLHELKEPIDVSSSFSPVGIKNNLSQVFAKRLQEAMDARKKNEPEQPSIKQKTRDVNNDT